MAEKKKIKLVSRAGKKSTKKDKRTDTIRQQRLVKLLSENIGNPKGGAKTMKEILLLAGYSESVAEQQTSILRGEGVQRELQPIVRELIDERDEVIKSMKKKRKGASYGTLLYGIEVLTKNIQLLTGGATDREEFLMSPDQMDRLHEIYKQRNKKNEKK